MIPCTYSCLSHSLSRCYLMCVIYIEFIYVTRFVVLLVHTKLVYFKLIKNQIKCASGNAMMSHFILIIGQFNKKYIYAWSEDSTCFFLLFFFRLLYVHKWSLVAEDNEIYKISFDSNNFFIQYFVDQQNSEDWFSLILKFLQVLLKLVKTTIYWWIAVTHSSINQLITLMVIAAITLIPLLLQTLPSAVSMRSSEL